MVRNNNNNNSNGGAILSGRMIPALELLVEAYHYAKQLSADRWDFAVESDQFIELGLRLNDFRWLVKMGIVVHQLEVTLSGENGRHFRSTGNMSFPEGTCFVITDFGIQFFKTHDPLATLGEGKVNETPSWNPEFRELYLSGVLVKQFKWRAQNQELILNTFEEENWIRRIDDPLPPVAEIDSKRRLCDTIKCLNRKQINNLIRFRGDGTGEAILWEEIPFHK